MNIKKCVVIAIAILSTQMIKAQETHGDSEVWFLLLNNHTLNKHWSVGNETHFRRTAFLSDYKQFIIRPYVNFKPKENVIYTVGYSYVRTHPYGKYPLPAVKPEHNFWEQVTVNQSLGRTHLSHRYRMEHRYQQNLAQNLATGEITKDGYNFSNRFRYRLTLKQPINEDYFIQAFDELWVAFDKHFKEASYNQNWIYVGFGKNIPNGNIQVAYLHQHANAGGIVERHHSLQFTLQYDF